MHLESTTGARPGAASLESEGLKDDFSAEARRMLLRPRTGALRPGDASGRAILMHSERMPRREDDGNLWKKATHEAGSGKRGLSSDEPCDEATA